MTLGELAGTPSGAGTGRDARAPTIVDAIEAATATGCGVTSVETGQSCTWGALYDRACRLAAVLCDLDLGPGRRVAVLAQTSLDTVATIEAVWLSGATLVVLPLPTRITSTEALVAELARRLVAADASLLVVDGAFASLADGLAALPAAPPWRTIDELERRARRARPWRRPDVTAKDTAVVQFTSGSTGDPRGVVVSHGNVTANVSATTTTIGYDLTSDVLMLWVPFFHDMGLFGLAFTMLQGGTEVIADPTTFLADPGRWMEWLSAYRATMSAGPNFSFAMATRGLRGRGALDLSAATWLLNASEPVVGDLVRGFCDAGAAHGLRPPALSAGYGLAESTLAVTLQPMLAGVRFDTIDRCAFEHDQVAHPVPPGAPGAKELAVVGRPITGTEVRVAGADGTWVADRSIGEVMVRGDSVAGGYFRNAEATEQAFRDGWLATGDLGYLADGELVVCGRRKDVLFVAGRNVYPDDIERLVEDLPGIRKGNVIAAGGDGFDGPARIVVMAEHRSDDPAALQRTIRDKVSAHLGIRLHAVELVEPGALPKTSSGKRQRTKVAEVLLGS